MEMIFVVAGPGAAMLAEALNASPEAWASVVPAESVGEVAERFAEARFVATGGADPPLPPARWTRVDDAALEADPRAALGELCAFLGIAYDQALITPYEAARRAALAGDGAVALRSVSTDSFGAALAQLGSALLISTYQTGKLVCARSRDGHLNTHFRDVDKPMGVAVGPGRFALGSRTEVWDYRDMPDAAANIEPAGSHDACFLPRNRHVTGDIGVHEMAFAGGELWVVATAFSCLATLDAEHSFMPRWAPPFITRLLPEDRCHLNGLAVAGDRITHVTALGRSDVPGGWRETRAEGGVLLDVAGGEIALAGLSMPHSPRWHDERLWLLESGRGTLAVADLDAGTVETVAELPGFTRGLAFAGDVAFVGLSQVRETSTFGDLPLTRRLSERQCGVWMLDVRSGEIVGFLRFEDLVQEIFDLAFLPGIAWPEIAEPTGQLVTSSYVLP